jgi:hypothetical protein
VYKVRWNTDEIKKTVKAFEYAGENENAKVLRVPVEVIESAEFRRRVGTLRGGNTVVIVTFRGAPACVAIPHPVSLWDDGQRFVSRVIAGRNQYLTAPYCEPDHPWHTMTTEVKVGPMEEIRRKTAWVFANVLRNTVFLATYYDQYEVLSLIPVPPGMPMAAVQILARSANRYVRLPKSAGMATLEEHGMLAPLSVAEEAARP